MDNARVISLSNAIKNKSYRIFDFSPNSKLDLRKLYNVGLTIESEITPLYDSMIKGSVAYLIKGSVIAIRNKDADNILVCLNM